MDIKVRNPTVINRSCAFKELLFPVLLYLQLNQCKAEMSHLKRLYEEQQSQLSAVKNNQTDKDKVIRSLRQDRKRHLEEVLELK